MSKLTVSNVTNLGGNPAAAQITINANNAAIVEAIENTVSRDGSTPNQMESTFDMNGHRILNVGRPVQLDDALRLRDLLGLGEGDNPPGVVPAGGTDGQVLTKTSDDDYEYDWADPVHPIEVQLACSNLTSNLTVAENVGYFRAPRAFTIEEVRASLLTSSSSGAVEIDIDKNGSSIFSTPLTIDADELTSTTAATPAVISDTDAADDDLFAIHISGAGTGAKGLIVTILGTR